MVVALLRSRGYRVVYLGADVDTPFLLEAVRLHHPDAVLLSARGENEMHALTESIAAVTAERGRREHPHIIVGGQLAIAQPEAIAAMGATAVAGTTVSDATATVTGILPRQPGDSL
jgi:methanogenic corrinoid protein MtbC1